MPQWFILLLRHYAALIRAGLGNQAAKGIETMFKLRIAIFAGFVAFGAYNHFHYKSVCGDTNNPALCQLSINAGESDEAAHNAGNGIYN